MTFGSTRSRSGITLIEILISIAIMGIGVISIATLFPLGLIRLRNAQRLTRGAYLVESATADLGARNLLSAASFFPNALYQTTNAGFYNPLYVDTATYGSDWADPKTGIVAGANRFSTGVAGSSLIGSGLPVAYDPLWRSTLPSFADPLGGTGFEGRFGADTAGLLRNEGGTPAVAAHADGLQRVTNLVGTIGAAAAQDIFVSHEDVILQDVKGQYYDQGGGLITSPSPLVPDLNMSSGSATAQGGPTNDWRYSWFFTGMQSDPSSTDVDGEIVICENRPFSIDTIGGASQVGGEFVVEAIWGFSGSAGQMLSTTQGYGSLSASRSVYLRWSTSMPDPDVRVGGWIADVTYERNQSLAVSHYGPGNGLYPAQRCYWYQVAKKSAPAADGTYAGYRSMTVWTSSPLRAMSLMDFSLTPPAPVHVEAALIMPSVINVYPRTVYTR